MEALQLNFPKDRYFIKVHGIINRERTVFIAVLNTTGAYTLISNDAILHLTNE
jgi:hypothetical protein